MLIVISSNTFFGEEARILTSLFDNGLKYLHLRKPHASKCDYIKLLKEIPVKYHNCLILHEFHDLAKEYNIKGVHIKEHIRKEMVKNHIKQTDITYRWKELGKSVSSSFHSVANVDDYGFDYILLSPVFNSISKKGYIGKQFSVSQIKTPIVALGGIYSENIPKAMKMGYSGVASLGSIWDNKNILNNFLRIKDAYDKTYGKC